MHRLPTRRVLKMERSRQLLVLLASSFSKMAKSISIFCFLVIILLACGPDEQVLPFLVDKGDVTWFKNK